MSKSDHEETYTEAETEARREAALKRMFATPHKPHKPHKPVKARERDSQRRLPNS